MECSVGYRSPDRGTGITLCSDSDRVEVPKGTPPTPESSPTRGRVEEGVGEDDRGGESVTRALVRVVRGTVAETKDPVSWTL